MEINELLDFLRTRRSIRRFRPDPIPDEYIEKMMEAARWAPSGANAQPWEFVIVKSPMVKKKIAEMYHQTHEEEHSCIEQTRIEELRHHQFAASSKDLPGFKEAPVLIVVCGDRRTLQASTLASRFIGAEGGSGGDATYLKNMANATFCLHLAAASLGLGSQWVSVSTQLEQLLKSLLDVPDVLQIHTIVPVGYPAYKPQTSYRRDLKEILHFEKYDRSRFRSGSQIIEYIKKLRGRTKSNYAEGRSP